MKKEFYIGVMEYKLNFTDEHSLDLTFDMIQEDKMIWTKDKNYLVLRHATIDLKWFSKICRGFKNKIKSIDFITEKYTQDGSRSELRGALNDCEIQYIALEGESKNHRTCKIVILYEDIEFME